MPTINDRGKEDIKLYSLQHIANQSFDRDNQVSVFEPVVYNPITGGLDKLVQPPLGTNIPLYDFLQKVATDSVTDTITYKSGGSGGTTVATLTLVYTDSGKTDISTITRT